MAPPLPHYPLQTLALSALPPALQMGTGKPNLSTALGMTPVSQVMQIPLTDQKKAIAQARMSLELLVFVVCVLFFFSLALLL